MKHLKTFEKLTIPELYDIKSQIKEYAVEVTFDEDNTYDDIDHCPYMTEIAILHQQDYVDEIYEYFLDDENYNIFNMSQKEFEKIYEDILIKSRAKILKYLLKDPSLYSKWPVDYEDLEIPNWIKAGHKYNL